MSDSRWKPWRLFQNTPQQLLPLDEPPCKWCKFWLPHADYVQGKFVGITCCVASKMIVDFSCFDEKEDTK